MNTNKTSRIFAKETILLALVLLVAGMLRIYRLGDLPSGFHNDEVLNGYVGRFTLQNGVDLYGNRLPLLYFDNFGDYPNILPMYISGLATYIFGVNELAVRLPIALAGIAAVFLIYQLTVLVFNDKKLALMAALVLAVTPWHIVLSRATAEGVTAGAVFLLGLWCWFKAVLTRRSRFLGLAAVLFGLTYFLYPSYRVFIPLALWPSFLLVQQKRLKLWLLVTIVSFGCLTLAISQTNWGKGRLNQTSVFQYNDVLKIRLTQAAFQDAGVPLVITRIFHNKIWAAGREIATQYFQYWSGEFLFTRGGLPERYRLADQGLEYLSFAGIGLLALGLYITAHKTTPLISGEAHKPLVYYVMYLLLLSPLPAAMTMEDTPNVHRAALTGMLLAIAFAIGINYVLARPFWLKRIVLTLFALAMTYEFGYFAHNYLIHATVTQAPYRHNEMKTIADYLVDKAPLYEAVYAPTISHLPLHYLFHAGIFDATLAGKFGRDSVIDHIGNIYFNAEQCPSDFLDYTQLPLKTLVIDRAECSNKPQLKTIATVKRADGYDAYTIKSLTGK